MQQFRTLTIFIAPLAMAYGCSGPGASPAIGASPSSVATPTATPSAAATASTSSSTPYTCPAASTVDCSRLALGDQKYSTSSAAVGSTYLCSAPASGSPVVASAPWLNASANTWDLTKKIAVAGSVAWSGSVAASLSSDGSTRTVTSNGLPTSPFTTGTFPIQSTDPAYAYDRNPNHIAAQTFSYALPANPSLATSPSCLPAGGIIALTTTGVAIYNPFDAAGYDGVAREIQDACHGHPDPSSTYHYHGFVQTCSGDTGSLTTNSSLIGYALDGFGIYGPWYGGKMLATADLDACHGITSAVMWDGKIVTMYHYVATVDFPYTLGCYRGTPVRR
jgi:hypothetical protein